VSKRTDNIVAGALIVVAFIHIGPLIGVAGAAPLKRLYGIDGVEATVMLLLQHRAVLFGILGFGILVSAFRRPWQVPAVVAGFVSTVSFVVLAWTTPQVTSQIQGVIAVDLVAIALLVVVAVLRLPTSSSR
jgi:hypothetical protein